MSVSPCASCGKAIRLLQVYPSGRWIPFNADAVSCVVFDSEMARVKISDDPKERPRTKPPDAAEWGRVMQVWQPHWATCPATEHHRRPKA
jgi:hypothetical protein